MTPFLLTAENPHAAVRANGMRGWYYSSRRAPIRLLVVHTAETDPSPASAENVSRWQRDTATVPSSYHSNHDSDSSVTLLPDSFTAFHCVGFNSPSLGYALATRAAWWGRYPSWDRPALERAAVWAASRCIAYDIPPRELTRAQAAAGGSGIARHSTLDPVRRSDPGATFPMQAHLARIRQLLEQTATPDPTFMEALMAGEQQLGDIGAALATTAVEQGRLVETSRVMAQVAVAEQIAATRTSLGLDPEPASDAVWIRRVAIDRTHTLADALDALADRAKGQA